MATTFRDINLADLRLDGANPRHTPEAGQRETIGALLGEGGSKLVELARDIAGNGLSPMEPLLVTQLDKKSYVALEGNRRLAALKLLDNPSLAGKDSLTSTFRTLANSSTARPTSVRCCVLDSREEAEHWLRLRHTGENKGAGVVPWSAEQVQRFSGRGGNQAATGLAFADLITTTFPGNASLQANLRKVRKTKLTTLGRLLQDPEVRRAIGLVRSDAGFRSHYQSEAVEETLERLLADLAGPLSVSVLKSKEQRASYISGLPLPDPNTYSAHATPLQPRPSTTKRKKRKPAPPKSLFAELTLSKLSPRIVAIFDEVRQLDVDRYPNAVGVLLRVSLELAVDDFLAQTGMDLAGKLKDKVRRALRKIDPTEKDERYQPVRVGLGDGTSLLAVSTVHAFVHNPHYHPTPSELRSIAANYEGFIEGLDAALP